MRPQTVTVTGTAGTSSPCHIDMYTPYSAVGIQVTVTGTAGTTTVQNTTGDIFSPGAPVVWGTTDIPAGLVAFTGTSAYSVIPVQGYSAFRVVTTGADVNSVATMRQTLTGLA